MTSNFLVDETLVILVLIGWGPHWLIDKMIDDRDEAAICHMDAAVSVSVVSANGKL